MWARGSSCGVMGCFVGVGPGLLPWGGLGPFHQNCRGAWQVPDSQSLESWLACVLKGLPLARLGAAVPSPLGLASSMALCLWLSGWAHGCPRGAWRKFYRVLQVPTCPFLVLVWLVAMPQSHYQLHSVTDLFIQILLHKVTSACSQKQDFFDCFFLFGFHFHFCLLILSFPPPVRLGILYKIEIIQQKDW